MSSIRHSIPVRPRVFSRADGPRRGSAHGPRRYRERLAACLILSALALAGAPVRADVVPRAAGAGFPREGDTWGGWRFYPWVNLLLGYDSNIFRSNNEIGRLGGLGVEDSWLSTVEPGIRATRINPSSSFDASYYARIGNVFSSPDDNFIDQQATLTGNWEWRLRHRMSLDYQYWNWHDPRGTGSPVDSARANFSNQPDRWLSNRVTLGYSFGAPGARGRIDLLAGYRSRDYINNNQESRDNDRLVLDAAFYARWTPKLSWLLDLGWEQIDYTRQAPGTTTLDSDQTTLYTGLTWDMTGKTTGTAKAGWLTKDFVSNQREDVSDVGWSAAVQWRPRTYSTFNLATERTPAETTTGAADAVVVSLVRLDWVHYWKARLYSRVGAFGTNDDYIGSPVDRVDHRYGASGGLFLQVRRYLELGVDYNYEERTSDESLAQYTANSVLFSLKYAP